MSESTLSATAAANPHLVAIVGGQPGPRGTRTARHEYRLGCAWDGNTLLVTILNGDDANVGVAFEANSFDGAFERALEISEDVADEAGHLLDGVLVSLTEYDSLAEIGIDAG